VTDSETADDAVQAALKSSPAREVTVRFSHVDAAAIVFYPRFIELCAQAFPEFVPPDMPCTLSMTFRKPIMLGDRLSLVLDGVSTGEHWRLSGRIDDDEHLSVVWRARPAGAVAPDAHRPDEQAFVSDVLPVQAWCVGASSRLQLSRYYEFVNTAIEQWFARDLGRPLRMLHEEREGIPTVSMETDCAALPGLGDEVRLWIRPLRIGGRSLRFESWLVRDGTCLIKTTQVIVFVKLDTGGVRSVEVPRGIRSRLRQALPGGAPE
jgi:acyl-CoA thioesterase FadM